MQNYTKTYPIPCKTGNSENCVFTETLYIGYVALPRNTQNTLNYLLVRVEPSLIPKVIGCIYASDKPHLLGHSILMSVTHSFFYQDSALCMQHNCMLSALDFLSPEPCPTSPELHTLITRFRELYISVSVSRE